VARCPDIGDAWGAIDIDETKYVTGVNKVRILDLGIDIPDFGPIPGVGALSCENALSEPRTIVATNATAVIRRLLFRRNLRRDMISSYSIQGVKTCGFFALL
jgi:hypothetical protein